MEVVSIILSLSTVPSILAVAGTTMSRGQIGLIAGLVGLCMVLMLSARRRASGMASPRAYAREQVARLREENSVREDMEELLASVQDTARDLSAQLDTRFRKLEHVLREADSRIAQLERLLRTAAPAPAKQVAAAEPRSDRPAPGPPPNVNPRFASIYEQADAGKSTLEIAQSTGCPPGEVELLLALRDSTTRPQLLSVCG